VGGQKTPCRRQEEGEKKPQGADTISRLASPKPDDNSQQKRGKGAVFAKKKNLKMQ